MKNINRVIVFLFIISLQNGFSQELIKAKINIDYKGQMTIEENIENYFISDTLLLHKSIPLGRNNKEVLINKLGVFRNTYLQYKNTDGIVNYSVNPPKSSYDNYFLIDSVFFISENYLALSKRTFNNKKKVDLNISLPLGFNLVYPKEENLLDSFYKTPPIIAGNFKENLYKDYCIYNRQNTKVNEERIEDIISIIDEVFTHFQTIFSNRNNRPDIVFLPFKGRLAGMNIDNLIILNESFLTNEWLNKKTLIHETLHLWWGDNSIRFENPVLTEAITEFLTLNYLKKIKEFDYLERQLLFKKRNIRDVKSYNLNFNEIDNKKTYKVYCYDLLPLLLWATNEKTNVMEILIEFYRNNSNSFVSVSNGNNLLEKIGIPILQ